MSQVSTQTKSSTKLHVGQLVNIKGFPAMSGRIEEFIGDHWVMVLPAMGGWPKLFLRGELEPVETENGVDD